MQSVTDVHGTPTTLAAGHCACDSRPVNRHGQLWPMALASRTERPRTTSQEWASMGGTSSVESRTEVQGKSFDGQNALDEPCCVHKAGLVRGIAMSTAPTNSFDEDRFLTLPLLVPSWFTWVPLWPSTGFLCSHHGRCVGQAGLAVESTGARICRDAGHKPNGPCGSQPTRRTPTVVANGLPLQPTVHTTLVAPGLAPPTVTMSLLHVQGVRKNARSAGARLVVLVGEGGPTKRTRQRCGAAWNKHGDCGGLRCRRAGQQEPWPRRCWVSASEEGRSDDVVNDFLTASIHVVVLLMRLSDVHCVEFEVTKKRPAFLPRAFCNAARSSRHERHQCCLNCKVRAEKQETVRQHLQAPRIQIVVFHHRLVEVPHHDIRRHAGSPTRASRSPSFPKTSGIVRKSTPACA